MASGHNKCKIHCAKQSKKNQLHCKEEKNFIIPLSVVIDRWLAISLIEWHHIHGIIFQKTVYLMPFMDANNHMWLYYFIQHCKLFGNEIENLVYVV